MWGQATAAFLRERRHHYVGVSASKAGAMSGSATTSTVKRFMSIASVSKRFMSTNTGSSTGSTVAVQLDYYFSLQFAGIAHALVNGGYDGIGDNLVFLPTCRPGMEMERVREYQNQNPTAVSLGTVEQNIFSPLLHSNPSLEVSAISAMFRTSPLSIASLNTSKDHSMTIGAHEDTVELLRRIFPRHKVVASPRATKLTDLRSKKYDAIQVYSTTEVPTLLHYLGSNEDLTVTKLEGLDGSTTTKLGYSQVLFGTNECLVDDRREVVQAFLHATFDGWRSVIQQSPTETVEIVNEAKKMLNLDHEQNDHWSTATELEMLKLTNNHVKETFQGDRYGVISPKRWNAANQWLLGSTVKPNFGLDARIWQPSPQLLAGDELALCTLSSAADSAKFFKSTYGRAPSLSVITVGELERYTDSKRRLQLYSNSSNSWFSKTSTGKANGFDVSEINLPAKDTTTEALLSVINEASSSSDGIQLMWPLPDHIDSTRVYNAIDIAKDADGIHYIGQCEISSGSTKDFFAPVAAQAAMALAKHYNIDFTNTRVLVIGRSPIVGSPIAYMARQAGGIVTTVHSGIGNDMLKELVSESDVIFTCAGQPGLVKAEWIDSSSRKTQVINVGSTFVDDALQSDVAGDIGKYAARYSPVPGGVGSLSLPFLLRNTVRAAWNQKEKINSVDASSWKQNSATLTKSFHFKDYPSALEFANKLDGMSTIMNHHANMKISHRCVDGVDMDLEFFTFEANALTVKDYDAAWVADMIYSGNAIKMSDYSYNLKEESIAKYPASPRGSSKLLHVDGHGRLSYYKNFSESIGSLLKGSHVVFNDSRVLDARLFVDSPSSDGQPIELMLLDLGQVDTTGTSCNEVVLRAMIRSDQVKQGDFFKETSGGVAIEVKSVEGVWQEDAKSDGNGMECLVCIKSELFVDEFLEKSGSTPIPPYFGRKAEPSDKKSYNNVYAAPGGSVAAPTAGLHFTDEVLATVGVENCSFLSLHVGAGTFKPVMVEDARDHEMHAESFTVSVREIKMIIGALESGKSLVVVGTTSCRTLESLFWCGVKRIRGFPVDTGALELNQFEWIPLTVGESKTISRIAALKSLVDGLDDSSAISGRTSLMITPDSYNFKVVDHLVTNFHAPDSTLMLLVSAFLKSGSKIKQVYELAQEKGYRFLSYGDSCFFSSPGSK